MEIDPTRMCELLVGLPDVDVLGVEQPVDGRPMVVHVRCRPGWQNDCPRCGAKGWAKGYRVVRLTDLPVFGPPGGAGLAQGPPDLS